MQEIEFEIPWPPSVNQMYTNNWKAGQHTGKFYVNSKGQTMPVKIRGRQLSKIARAYKKSIAEQIFYTFPNVKYGNNQIHVTIKTYPKDNKIRDCSNGLKILYDAIEMSRIIENDRQIVSYSVERGENRKVGMWKVCIRPHKSVKIDMSPQ